MCSFVGRVLACCKQRSQSHFWARADGSTSDPGHRKWELLGGWGAWTEIQEAGYEHGRDGSDER